MRLARRALVVTAAALLTAACLGPARWQELGYESEEQCWRDKGWTPALGYTSPVFEHWCGR